MFSNAGYMTRRFADEIPMGQQLFMIETINTYRNNSNVDYLQVFELSEVIVNGRTCQRIVHSQERPPYKKVYTIETDEVVRQKIFVIDDEDYHTFLLAEEY